MNHTTSQIRKLLPPLAERHKDRPVPQIPTYLEDVYWWAYVRPNAISFFERQWLVNLILLGNFVSLRDKALAELEPRVHGRTLQVACVYGDFTPRLVQHIGEHGMLDVVDVVPAQLENLRHKLPASTHVRLHQSDSASLKFNDETYDQAILFFLLHEMPAQIREQTLAETLRVLKPGGKLVIVDYHKPSRFNPLRYLFPIMFKMLEPFALAIWKHEIQDWFPRNFTPASVSKETMFGGLYQKVVIQK